MMDNLVNLQVGDTFQYGETGSELEYTVIGKKEEPSGVVIVTISSPAGGIIGV